MANERRLSERPVNPQTVLDSADLVIRKANGVQLSPDPDLAKADFAVWLNDE